MTNRAIVVGMAATFIGLTALLLVAGVVVSPVLLAVAVPFAVVAYFLWYHASGRSATASNARQRRRPE
nr:hypothetical protein [Halorubrum saccharovorum]